MAQTKEQGIASLGTFDRFFEDFWRPWGALAPQGNGFVPSLDVVEDDKEFAVKVELPGLTEKDVQIEIDGNVLSIRGEKKWQDEEKGKDYHRVERRYGGFLRQVTIPQSADATKASASQKDGLLTVRFPKKAEARKKSIPISK